MLEKRSISLSGHRTSIALEPEFWEALGEIAAREDLALARLIGRVDSGRMPEQPLASALRVYVLRRLPRLTEG
jgi:predicted DNA-binding ribbon-helix-helix protein